MWFILKIYDYLTFLFSLQFSTNEAYDSKHLIKKENKW